jgi:magnesium-transporting ATPase (P-type)
MGFLNWENMDVQAVLRHLDTDGAGLSSEDAARRLAAVGPNVLGEEARINRVAILLHQLTSPLIYVLLAAAAVTIFLREFIDTGVILAVVILNAVIGYVQEYKAEQGVRALKKIIQAKARVVRDSQEREVLGHELVPGDLVYLAAGMKVPADIRLMHVLELKADESMLTGESLPSEKTVERIAMENLTPGDQKNMAFMGTTVVYGRGKGVVVDTGSRTIIGDVAEKVREVGIGKAPLQERLEGFARFLSWVVGAAASAIFVLGILRGEQLTEMFIVAVAVAVSAIPEGLPVAVTIAMAIGVSRMARRHAIVRRLPSVETLGSTTVIGSDKTGTLTRNEMTVRLLYDGYHTYEVSGAGYEPVGSFTHDGSAIDADRSTSLAQALRIGLLCNEANLYTEDGEFKVDGDPTEGALIVSAIKGGLNVEEERDRFAQLGIIPFESERGYMATLHRAGEKNILLVKGAPEKVLDYCIGCSGDSDRRMEILHVASTFASEGLRVLAMAFKEVKSDVLDLTHRDLESGLSFSGLQGMMDPPRPEVVEAIKDCRRAGVRTVMITGDHAGTAGAVARSLGIGGEDPQVLEGRNIEGMGDDTLRDRARDVSVFARVAPAHKLRIVQQLMALGEVVAVTGDGVNDAPALKAAHIGVAMGRSGTDVAKEASDIVLSDDNFASIVAAVREGRIVYDNIKKVILFLVSCGMGELLAIAGAMAAGLPLPYLPAQILWLNLVTNGFQDVALAFEPGEKGVLNRPPRDPGEGILSSVMIQRTLLMGVVMGAGTLFTFILELRAGVSLESARTVALTTMVFFQFYQALNCRSERRSVFTSSLFNNPFLFMSMVAAFFAHFAVLYVPAFQYVFRTVPLTQDQWGMILMTSTLLLLAVELEKWVRRRRVVSA